MIITSLSLRNFENFFLFQEKKTGWTQTWNKESKICSGISTQEIFSEVRFLEIVWNSGMWSTNVLIRRNPGLYAIKLWLQTKITIKMKYKYGWIANWLLKPKSFVKKNSIRLLQYLDAVANRLPLRLLGMASL